jgi:hypothetical protein
MREDVELPAAIGEADQTLSAPATQEILQRSH